MSPSGAGRRIAYLALETPREGQASHTHVTEIIAGLRRGGWQIETFFTSGGGASSGAGFVGRVWSQLALQARLALRLKHFDAVFIRSHFMAWPLAMLARLRRLPLVHEINGQSTDVLVTYPQLRPIAGIIAWLYRSQYRAAAHLITVTDGLAEWARQFSGHDRISVIPNGANTQLFRPDGASDISTGRCIVFVGGLVAWHGIATMLKALDDPAWPDGVRLVVAGDGIERARLEAASNHPRLVWNGRLAYADVPKLLRGAVAALCVIEDPQGRSATGVAPLKLFEALACGVPVIVSDLPFQADLIRALDAGAVIPAGNASALATAVASLAADPARAKAMGGRGADYVHEHASWQARANATGRILHEVIHARA